MIPTWIARLIDETVETTERLNKLNDYMKTEEFADLDRENKDLLYEQQRVMSMYVQILGMRLEKNGYSKDLKNRMRKEVN